ncbi:MAG TPA: hypothetical protein VGB63_13420 [Pedobacter sp.]|jgi:hypothetical protein
MPPEIFKIQEELNEKDSNFDHTELPEDIRQIVKETIVDNWLRCLDPEKSKGRCLQVSHELMNNLAAIGKIPFVHSKLVFRHQPKPHFWLYVDGFHIDLTARQFSPLEQCPKVWKLEDFDSSEYYYVERGRGLVLFKLVPFNKKSFFANVARGIFLSSWNKSKTIASSAIRKGYRILSIFIARKFHPEVH